MDVFNSTIYISKQEATQHTMLDSTSYLIPTVIFTACIRMLPRHKRERKRKGDLRTHAEIYYILVETYTTQFSYCISLETCWKGDCLLRRTKELTLAAMLCGSFALPWRARGLRFVFKAGPRALPLVLFCTFWCAAALMTSSLLHPSWHFPGMGFLFCGNIWFLLPSTCKTDCYQTH